MPGPLDGLRIVDLSSGAAGGLATMVLADFGADVIKVEPPGGDPYRFQADARMWLRGKRSVVLDLAAEDDRGRLRTLLDGADALLTSLADGEARACGLDDATLLARNPGLVYCHLSAFGPRGPWAGYPLHEGVVAAKGGRMMVFEGTAPRPGPQFPAVHVATHTAAQASATGILAALIAREQTGRGQRIETSLLQGLMTYDLGGLSMAALVARHPTTWGAAPEAQALPAMRLPTINYQPAMAADGKWVQMGNLLQHLFDNFCTAAELFEIYTEPRFQGAPASWQEADREEFRDRLFTRMREKPAAEWQRIFSDQGGVVSTTYQTTQEALDDPDLVRNGHVIDATEPASGGRIRMLGPVARLTQTPADVRIAAPAVGEHTAAVLAEPARTPAARGAGATLAHTLEGVTVLDFATIIAAPLGSSHLADLGARVIKVEQLHGDPWRWMGSGGLGAIRTNQGKESICIDLKTKAGQEVVHALIARADILIHNYRPGVPQRLGVSYEDARALNPRIVYLNVNGYGPDGPSAHRPATHPIPGAAVGGATWQAGSLPTGTSLAEIREGARRLFRSNEVNPDPNTSAVVATTAMLGLWASRVRGVGQEIFIDMMGANAYANHDDFFSYDGREPRPRIDDELMGVGPLERLYRAAEGWVFLGLPLQQDWERFAEHVGRADLLADARFATRASRGEHADALIEALAALFATRPADHWEQTLAPHGLGCVRADTLMPGPLWRTDDHIGVNEFRETVVHPRHGEVERHGPVVRTRGLPNRIASGPLAGQQTDAILGELGYDAAQVTRLHEANVVWTEEGVPAL